MRKYCVIALACVSLLAASQPADAKPFRQYDHKLMFNLPDEWQCTQQSSGQILATWVDPNMVYGINTLTLVHQQLPAGYTLTDYVNNTIMSESKMLWQYELLDKQLIDHSYGPYYRLTFTWRLSWEQPLYVMQMITCRYPNVYVLTGTAPGNGQNYYTPIFQKLFDSLAFVN